MADCAWPRASRKVADPTLADPVIVSNDASIEAYAASSPPGSSKNAYVGLAPPMKSTRA